MQNNNRYVPISAVTRYIKRLFENDGNLQDVWVKGELSNVKLHSRGHLYFTLKDANSRVNAVMFAGNNRYLNFKPEEGMHVLIQGSFSVYEPQGQYQLYVRTMQQDGVGNLFQAYEALKNKLEQEGLFEPTRKKLLPKFPAKIGVITSPTGAAVRDIVTTIKRRFPLAAITLYPVLVQGPGAAPSIARAIEQANYVNKADVLIVGRGGGSIEELWAFNEEIVARAIHSSQLPVISAVGHETDFTISDFVADLRAPTPTAAAEMAVPHLDELGDRLFQRNVRLKRVMKDYLSVHQQQLFRLQKSYAFKYPTQLVKQKEQELDRNLDKLKRTAESFVGQHQNQLTLMKRQLSLFSPAGQLQKANERIVSLHKLLVKETNRHVRQHQTDFSNKISRLSSLNPLAIMDRGYSLTYKQGKKELVKSVKQVKAGEALTIKLKDGQIDCHITGTEASLKND
ncbi:exodeoxyribonuclease VII large subunit [Fictibacillus barbaricus]|uniref:Exodeoxyribonuclease 7 large subunit n=1 Tax=Fictibacillus barbaricus TaxID=182136 RepID=A0ABS2ZJ67_9BACL|nr:exodeoxyribonuclease VII large subunit [Fictibacillus barbaricus]MBN3547707.1 exodeoxyribonuclease VII large subunit [Fictibacillus barbaricus]GGB50945.1 exodeoxyribonuclease 7 large subunit [Fictibacillus barbaricus]